MEPGKVIYDGLKSTSLMTLFSYLASGQEDKNFKEPVLLDDVAEHEGMNRIIAKHAGWMIHYGFGMVWTVVMRYIILRTGIKPNALSGLLLGSIGGLIAVASWHPLIKRYRLVFKKNEKRFYSHLVLAHIIFTLSLMHELKKELA